MPLTLKNAMLYSPEHTVISIPITEANREQALSFAKQQPTPEQAAQVYRNTLAVLAVHYYCQMIDVPTELENSYSWNPIARMSADVADLYIPEVKGRLECRSVEEESDRCYVPQEVQSDRIGYMAVRLNESCTEGTILGFVLEATREHVPLSYFRPLDVFIDRLSEGIFEEKEPILTSLVDWTVGIFEGLWQPLEALPPSRMVLRHLEEDNRAKITLQLQRKIDQFLSSHEELSTSSEQESEIEDVLLRYIEATDNEETRFEAAELLWQLNPEHPAVQARQAINLKQHFAGQSIALLVALLPTPDERASILLRVYATEKQYILPPGLTLSGLDENGDVFFSVQARSQDYSIQFPFIADWGDRFSVHVALDEAEFLKNFVI